MAAERKLGDEIGAKDIADAVLSIDKLISRLEIARRTKMRNTDD